MKRIFVFGSNLAGRHGKGAAKEAIDNWGAVYGVGEGRTGDSYAIPTKDGSLKTRNIEDIRKSVQSFRHYANNYNQYLYLLTPIGSGLAGIDRKIIAEMFLDIPDHIVLTSSWLDKVWWE